MSNVQDALLRAVGSRVREARTAAHLSQEQLAQRIGVTRSSVANLEAGRQDMNLSRIAGILAALGIDLNVLIQPGDLPVLPPAPHVVEITPVFEVCCITCGSTVLDAPRSRAEARRSRDDHIVAMKARNNGEGSRDE